MNAYVRKGKAGFSLIELLVVMLIIAILAMALWPIIRKRVVQAQYTANGIPVAKSVQTEVELFSYENGHLPGLLMANRVPAASPGDSQLDASYGMVQGWIADNTTDVTLYRPALYSMIDGGAIAGTQKVEYEPGTMPDVHIKTDLDLSYEDLTTRLCKPSHVQYLAPVGGYQSTSYAYAIGVFGDGDGLPSGTGYATLYIKNAHTNIQQLVIAQWDRYAADVETPQLQFAVGQLDGDASPSDEAPYVWLPALDQMTNDTASVWDQMLTDLRNAGWDL